MKNLVTLLTLVLLTATAHAEDIRLQINKTSGTDVEVLKAQNLSFRNTPVQFYTVKNAQVGTVDCKQSYCRVDSLNVRGDELYATIKANTSPAVTAEFKIANIVKGIVVFTVPAKVTGTKGSYRFCSIGDRYIEVVMNNPRTCGKTPASVIINLF